MKRQTVHVFIFLLGFPCCLKAQTDSLVDVFPLAIGNEWTYRYFTLTQMWPAGNPVETRTDSGDVTYNVSGSVSNIDSARWQFQLRRDLTRHRIIWPISGNPRDTTYPIRDSSSFELIESHQGQHQLYRNGDPGTIHLDVIPFTRNFIDTTLIYRFRRIGSGDTIAFRSALYPYVRSTFTFQKAVGVFRFRYNSGSMDVYDTAHHYLLNSVITSTSERTAKSQPERFHLSQNYPNPFNPSTIIRFQTVTDGLVTLRVFDVLGREVGTLVNETKLAGEYIARFDARTLSSGVYFYRLSAGDYADTKKLIVAK